MTTEDDDEKGEATARTADEARTYVPPTPIPPATRRDTLELEARVRIASTVDPRKAPTMPRLNTVDSANVDSGRTTPPGPPALLDPPVPPVAALLPDVSSPPSGSNVTSETLTDRNERGPDAGDSPPSRKKWRTDRFPDVQSSAPPPAALGSERPPVREAEARRSRRWMLPAATLLLLGVAVLTWSRLRTEPDEASAPAPSATVTVAPAATAAPPAEPSAFVPPPSESSAPSTKATVSKPRASAQPSAKPSSVAPRPAESPSSSPAPPSTAPPTKPEPPELVQ